MKIDDLPPELFINIFTFNTFEKIFTIFPRINKYIYNIISNSLLLWKNFYQKLIGSYLNIKIHHNTILNEIQIFNNNHNNLYELKKKVKKIKGLRVYIWGNNKRSILGIGINEKDKECVYEKPEMLKLSNKSILWKMPHSHERFQLGVDLSSRLYCWGGDDVFIPKYIRKEPIIIECKEFNEFLAKNGEIIVDVTVGHCDGAVLTQSGSVYISGDYDIDKRRYPFEKLEINEKVTHIAMSSFSIYSYTVNNKIFKWDHFTKKLILLERKIKLEENETVVSLTNVYDDPEVSIITSKNRLIFFNKNYDGTHISNDDGVIENVFIIENVTSASGCGSKGFIYSTNDGSLFGKGSNKYTEINDNACKVIFNFEKVVTEKNEKVQKCSCGCDYHYGMHLLFLNKKGELFQRGINSNGEQLLEPDDDVHGLSKIDFFSGMKILDFQACENYCFVITTIP